VLRRFSAAVVAVLLALVLAACGGEDSASNGAAATEAAPAPAEASVLVTRECGQEVVVEKSGVEAGQTAMQALQRVADVETDQGGKFVTAIEGIEQDESKMLAWLYYVNGEEAQKGASEIKLEVGDVEWWDLHNWETTCQVPAEAAD
jgi:Domain of unknown function (DUF4430)